MAESKDSILGYLSFYDDEEESENKLKTFELGEGTHSIGWNEDNKIVVQSSRTINERHAEIKLRRDFKNRPRCTLHDLGTVNGLFINGDHFSDPNLTHTLKSGDIIRFGYDRLNFTFGFEPPVAKEQKVGYSRNMSVPSYQQALQDTPVVEAEFAVVEEPFEDEVVSSDDQLLTGGDEVSSPLTAHRVSQPKEKNGQVSPEGDRLTELRIPQTPTVKSPLSSKSSIAWEIPLHSDSGDVDNVVNNSPEGHSSATLHTTVEMPSQDTTFTGRGSGKKVEVEDEASVYSSEMGSKEGTGKVDRFEFLGQGLAIAVEEELYLSELQRSLTIVNNLLEKRRFQAFYRGFVALKSHSRSSSKNKSSWLSYACFARYILMRLEAQRMAAACESKSNHGEEERNATPRNQDMAQEVLKPAKQDDDTMTDVSLPSTIVVDGNASEVRARTPTPIAEKAMPMDMSDSGEGSLDFGAEGSKHSGAVPDSAAAFSSEHSYLHGEEFSPTLKEQGTPTELDSSVSTAVKPNSSAKKRNPRLSNKPVVRSKTTQSTAQDAQRTNPQAEIQYLQKREIAVSSKSYKRAIVGDESVSPLGYTARSPSRKDRPRRKGRQVRSVVNPKPAPEKVTTKREDGNSPNILTHSESKEAEPLKTSLESSGNKASPVADKCPTGASNELLGDIKYPGETGFLAQDTTISEAASSCSGSDTLEPKLPSSETVSMAVAVAIPEDSTVDVGGHLNPSFVKDGSSLESVQMSSLNNAAEKELPDLEKENEVSTQEVARKGISPDDPVPSSALSEVSPSNSKGHPIVDKLELSKTDSNQLAKNGHKPEEFAPRSQSPLQGQPIVEQGQPGATPSNVEAKTGHNQGDSTLGHGSRETTHSQAKADRAIVQVEHGEASSNHVARNRPNKDDSLLSPAPPEASQSHSKQTESSVGKKSQVEAANALRVPALVDILLKMQLLRQLKATSHLLHSVQHSAEPKAQEVATPRSQHNEARPTKGRGRAAKASKSKRKGGSSKVKSKKSVFSSHASFLRMVLLLLKVRAETADTALLPKAVQAQVASRERQRVVEFARHAQRYMSRKHVTIQDFRMVDFRMEGLARVIRGVAPLQDTLYLSAFFQAWRSYHFDMHPRNDTRLLTPALDSCIRVVLQAKLLGYGPGSKKRRKRSSVILDRMIESRLDSNIDLRKMKAFLTWKETCIYLNNRDEAALLCLTKLDSMELSRDAYRIRKSLYKWTRQTKVACVLTKYVTRYHQNGWVYGFYILKWNWYRFKSYRFSLLVKVINRTQQRLVSRALHAFRRYVMADEVKDKCLDRSRLAIVYKRRGRMLSRSFRSWSGRVLRTRENENIAKEFCRKKSILNSCARWKLNAQVAKQRRRAKRRQLKRLFSKWVAKAEVWQLMARWRIMALKLKKKQYMRTRRKIISIVNARRCGAIKLRSFMKETRRTKLLQYFTLWRDGARSWKFMFLRYTAGKDRQLLRRTFGAWRYYFKVEVPKIRRRIKLAKFRILRYSFKMWRLWFVEQRDNRRRFRSMVRSLVTRKRTKLLRLHVSLWKKQWVLFSALNLVSRIFIKLERKSKRRAVQHWSRATYLIKYKHAIDQMKCLAEKSTAVQEALDQLKRCQIEADEAEKQKERPEEEEECEQGCGDEEFEQGGGDEEFYQGGDENLPSQNVKNAADESVREHPQRPDVVAMEKTSTILKKLNEFDLLEKKLLNERKAAQKEIENWSRRLARHGKEKQILEEEVVRIQRNSAREKRELETTIQLYEKRLYKLNKTISDAARFESPLESQQAMALIHGQVGAAIKAEAKARAKYEQLCEAMKNLKNSKKRTERRHGLAKTMEHPKRNHSFMNTVASQPVGSGAQAAKTFRDTSLSSGSNP